MKAQLIGIFNDKIALGIFIGLLGYVGLNIYAIMEGLPWVIFLAPALLMAAFAFLEPIKFWFFLVLITPFSIQADLGVLGSAISLPNEPYIAFILVLLVFKFLLNGKVNWQVLSHPITLIIIAQLLWMLMTSITSSMPLVSFKYLLSRTWYVVVFFFFAIQIFKKKENIEKYIWYASIATSLVIIYSIVRHAGEHFSHRFSYYASLPFFKDHNIYAVVIAFFIPPLVTYALKGKTMGLNAVKTGTYWLMSGLFTLGVVLSYTRAAWVSLVAAGALWMLMLLRVRLITLIGIASFATALVAIFWTDISMQLGRNKSESDNDLDTHVQSIYNVTTDDSNTERINRWSAALRMFIEEPVFGWGPNTYQHKYAPFQVSWQKTRISTNRGDLGNAHSEFIGPLAEMGLIGMLLVVFMVLAALQRSMNLFYKAQNPMVKYSGLFLTLSLVTYYVHGLLNNYLDVDKANVCLWACMASIVALDVFHAKSKADNSTKEMQ